MARFNKDRAPAAKAIAAKLPALLAACKKGNPADKQAIQAAAYAAQFFAAGDPTVHSQFEIYARAVAMQTALEAGRLHDRPARNETALSLYADSLIAWSKDSAYDRAVRLASEAAKAA